MTITVTNLRHGDTITYSLPLVIGDVSPPLTNTTISIHNNAVTPSNTHDFPVYNGTFKCLIHLVPGVNTLVLSYLEDEIEIVVNYRVSDIKRFVRPVYIVCHDDAGHFQGPSADDCSPSSAQKRIALGTKLLQSFTAEKMNEQGLNRKTFTLESDLDSLKPECHIHKSQLPVSKARDMEGGDLWMYFARELMSSQLYQHKENCKWFAFMSFTQYSVPESGIIPRSHSNVLRATKGHTALGGGGLALYGTGNLHTWAENLDQLVDCFTDTRKIDRLHFMDDSAYREFYWANYSTSLGASLHELGHTFDLAHTPTGVMARGFDDLYKVFTVQPLVSYCTSADNSRMSSPVPYSPKQSPIHRPHRGESDSRSGSPRPYPLLRPCLRSLPTVIQIEPAFKKINLRATQTFKIGNYDGSETKKTIARQRDGSEIVTDVTVRPGGEKVVKQMVKSPLTGKLRVTVSLSSKSETSHTQNTVEQASTSQSTITEPDLKETKSQNKPTVLSNNTSTEVVCELCSQNRNNQNSNNNISVDTVNKSECVDSYGNKTGDMLSCSLCLCANHKICEPNKETNSAGLLLKPTNSPVKARLTTPMISINCETTTTSSNTIDNVPNSKKIQGQNAKISTIKLNCASSTNNVQNQGQSSSQGHIKGKGPLVTPPPRVFTFPDTKHKDGGAHWYRSSAVLLYYHKWFNSSKHEKASSTGPQLIGNTIQSENGLRLVELRSLADGVVFHHWEFLQVSPPNQFQLKYSEILSLAPNLEELTVLAEDAGGNIMKKKLKIELGKVTEKNGK